MKVLLINPPRFHELIGKNPAIVEKHRGYNPPLGLLYLAGYIEENSDHQVDIIDCQPLEMSYDELGQELASREFDVCGLTAMTFTLIDVMMACREVRRANPKAKIILGGPHTHLFPEETISKSEVDFLMQGEGEIAFLQFLAKLNDPSSWPDIPGLVYKDAAGKIHNNGIAPSTNDLDVLGFPARHKLPTTHYRSLLGRRNNITTMFTSRGCPFRCTFCDRPFSPVISGFRWRTAGHIADEMEQCLAMGVDEAFIYDDTFTVRKDRVHQLCDEIISRGLKFTWDVRAHVNTVNKDLLKHMKEAGCDRIHYGVEVGNDRMMREIRKNTNVEKVKAAFSATRAVGMETLGYFMIGQQTETASDIDDTMDLARSLKPNYAHFTIFCPYPGTEIYQRGLETGIIKSDVWREFATDPQPGFELPVWEENFTREELRHMLVKCYKAFYMRPSFMLKAAARVRTFEEFKRKARAGLSVLTMRHDQKLYSDGKLRAKVRAVVPNASYDVHEG